MKQKIVLMAVTALTCFKFSYAQIKTKSVLLGGQLYYSSDVNSENNQPGGQKIQNSTFNISIGKALKENSIYGVNLTFSPYNINNNYNGININSIKTNQYSFGLFYRRYKSLAKDFYFFTELGAAYISSKQTYNDSVGVTYETSTLTGGQFFLTPGLSYKIFKKLQLEIIIPNIIMIQYQYTVAKDLRALQEFKHKHFLFNSNLNSAGSGLSLIGVGFHFIL
ncbi:MAG: hypothetical protein KGO81_12285 [Bacteroidota bacterium]|nr:hypothetical protein [Bacteroidota bacterium]